MNEYMIELWCFNLKDFREPLLSFELLYFRNSFCDTVKNSWSFEYKILGHVGLLGKASLFVSLGIAEILGFSKLSIYIEVILHKTFLQHFELSLCCKYWRSYEVLLSR